MSNSEQIIILSDGTEKWVLCSELTNKIIYDDNGKEIGKEKYPKDCYADEMVDDMYVPDEEKIADVTLTQARTSLVTTVEKHIQLPIDEYNSANGTLFGSVHNCNAYVLQETYPHQEFCITIVAFNAEVWEVARNIETDVLAGNRPMPSIDELKVELPTFGA